MSSPLKENHGQVTVKCVARGPILNVECVIYLYARRQVQELGSLAMCHVTIHNDSFFGLARCDSKLHNKAITRWQSPSNTARRQNKNLIQRIKEAIMGGRDELLFGFIFGVVHMHKLNINYNIVYSLNQT